MNMAAIHLKVVKTRVFTVVLQDQNVQILNQVLVVVLARHAVILKFTAFKIHVATASVIQANAPPVQGTAPFKTVTPTEIATQVFQTAQRTAKQILVTA